MFKFQLNEPTSPQSSKNAQESRHRRRVSRVLHPVPSTTSIESSADFRLDRSRASSFLFAESSNRSNSRTSIVPPPGIDKSHTSEPPKHPRLPKREEPKSLPPKSLPPKSLPPKSLPPKNYRAVRSSSSSDSDVSLRRPKRSGIRIRKPPPLPKHELKLTGNLHSKVASSPPSRLAPTLQKPSHSGDISPELPVGASASFLASTVAPAPSPGLDDVTESTLLHLRKNDAVKLPAPSADLTSLIASTVPTDPYAIGHQDSRILSVVEKSLGADRLRFASPDDPDPFERYLHKVSLLNTQPFGSEMSSVNAEAITRQLPKFHHKTQLPALLKSPRISPRSPVSSEALGVSQHISGRLTSVAKDFCPSQKPALGDFFEPIDQSKLRSTPSALQAAPAAVSERQRVCGLDFLRFSPAMLKRSSNEKSPALNLFPETVSLLDEMSPADLERYTGTLSWIDVYAYTALHNLP